MYKMYKVVLEIAFQTDKLSLQAAVNTPELYLGPLSLHFAHFAHIDTL